MTFAFTEFASALFISGLLIYWLRELAGARPEKTPKDWGCIKKSVFASQGRNQCALVYLTIFYMVLVTNFMVLNCTYYTWVKGDPSLAGRFTINEDQTMDKFLGPIVASVIIFIIYYAQFTMALSMGCVRLLDKKNSMARKVGFIVG